jgi:hypothetical protein
LDYLLFRILPSEHEHHCRNPEIWRPLILQGYSMIIIILGLVELPQFRRVLEIMEPTSPLMADEASLLPDAQEELPQRSGELAGICFLRIVP